MAFYHGKGGMVSWEASDLPNVQSWTAESIIEMSDSTEMGDSYRDFEYSFIDFNASATCQNAGGYDTMAVLGESEALTLELADGGSDQLSATAICSSISESHSVGGIGTMTFNFVCNDAGGLVAAMA